MATGGLLDGTTRFLARAARSTRWRASGTFSEMPIIPAIGAVKIPDDVPLEGGRADRLRRAHRRRRGHEHRRHPQGDTVAVIGCGGVGLNVIQGARIAGADRIIAVDMVDTKLDLAKQFGATDARQRGQERCRRRR